MNTFNFQANGVDFGNYSASTQEDAQQMFADDAGYESWAAMIQECGHNDFIVTKV